MGESFISLQSSTQTCIHMRVYMSAYIVLVFCICKKSVCVLYNDIMIYFICGVCVCVGGGMFMWFMRTQGEGDL